MAQKRIPFNAGEITVTDNSDLFKNAMIEAVLRSLEAVGVQIESIAKDNLQNSPMRIDTGLLRNSITHALSAHPAAIDKYQSNTTDKDGNPIEVITGGYTGKAPHDPDGKEAVYIGTNVDYAGYVHNGTVKMAANPFLKQAITENQQEIENIIRKHMTDAPEG